MNEQTNKCTSVLVFLSALFDGHVQDFDQVVDVLAAADGVADELQGVGDRNLKIFLFFYYKKKNVLILNS